MTDKQFPIKVKVTAKNNMKITMSKKQFTLLRVMLGTYTVKEIREKYNNKLTADETVAMACSLYNTMADLPMILTDEIKL